MIQPDIIATIKLTPTSEGGKDGPIIGNFNCIFCYKGEYYDCRLLVEDIGPINPGDTKMLPIKFYNSILIKPLLEINTKFQLKDYRILAEGIINKIQR